MSASSSVLITGASGGIARALAERLHRSGARLVLVARDVAQLADIAAPEDVVIAADVATQSGAADALAQATEALGHAPVRFAHCAGSTLLAPLHRTSEAQYREAMAANADSAFFALQAWLRARLDAANHASDGADNGAAAVLFSSVVAEIGVSNHEAISMAKGAVAALVAATAATYAVQGIRINAIAPGLTRTGATERLFASARAEDSIRAQYPLGRYGQASDPAALAAFLLGPEAGWITGQVVACDGGFSRVRPMVGLERGH